MEMEMEIEKLKEHLDNIMMLLLHADTEIDSIADDIRANRGIMAVRLTPLKTLVKGAYDIAGDLYCGKA